MRHVDAAAIIDLVEQGLTASEREMYHQHLSECRECAAEYDYWWTFLSGLGPSQLKDAPEDVIDVCITIFEKPNPSPNTFQKARILLDSFIEPLPAMGLRGTVVAARQLVLRVDGLDIHLRISGKESNRTIQGQLLPLTRTALIDGAQIELRVEGQPARFAFTDALGEFRFNDVPAGSCSFAIDLLSEGRIAHFLVQGG
jgi:hypothetical protein